MLFLGFKVNGGTWTRLQQLKSYKLSFETGIDFSCLSKTPFDASWGLRCIDGTSVRLLLGREMSGQEKRSRKCKNPLTVCHLLS
jgi:hypothetical protein